MPGAGSNPRPFSYADCLRSCGDPVRLASAARLIGLSLLAAGAVLLVVPLAEGVSTPGTPKRQPRWLLCDVGTSFAVGSGPDSNGRCGGSKEVVAASNCGNHKVGFNALNAVGSANASTPYTPDGVQGYQYTCKNTNTGAISGTFNVWWVRNCPAVGGGWQANWVHVLATGGAALATPCPDVEEEDECAEQEGFPASTPGYFPIGNSPTGSPVVTVCKDHCIAVFNGESPAGRRLNEGVYEYYAFGQYIFQGQQCTTGDSPSPLGDIPDDTCPDGKVLVNKPGGKKSCVDPETDEEQNPNEDDNKCPSWCGCGTKTTTNPDGSVDTVVTTWEEAGAGGHACVKKSYHDPDGDGPMPGGPGSGSDPVQTDEEQHDGGGGDGDGDGGGDGDGPSDPMDEFCEKNPNNPMCSDSGFSGACSGGFSCDGDAVQCAIAKAANETNCAFKSTDTSVDDILSAGGLDGKENALKTSLTATEHDVSSLLEVSSRDLSGSCPAPFTGSVLGGSFEVDVSPLCDLAEILGTLLMLSAALISARIIAGGA